MLLLVLILVVIAFGLLVVALLSGSVLWAWVSVGVSVVAAAVLLIDWLQRRAAVKAGAAPAVESATGAPAPLANAPMGLQPGMGRPPMADMDPATEVLPIVPASSRGTDDQESPTVMAKASQQAVSSPPQAPESRPSEVQETVVMSAVQPSGSPARPPGAEHSVTSSSAFSSPTVTGDAADRSAPAFGTGESKAASGTAGVAAAGAAAAAAGAVFATSGASPEKPAGPLSEEARADQAPSLQKASLQKASLQKAEKDGKADNKGPDAAEPTGASVVGAPAAEEPKHTPVAEKAAEAAPAGAPDAESTVKVEAHTKSRAESPSKPAAQAEDVDLFGAAPVAPLSEHTQAERSQAEPTAAGPAPVEEAPEEPRDPVAAEMVSGLDDEVVVVDEQPRYHVAECRALVAVPVIPLPVREAVELGFTPCGWCSPDRTLAGRHQTASR